MLPIAPPSAGRLPSCAVLAARPRRSGRAGRGADADRHPRHRGPRRQRRADAGRHRDAHQPRERHRPARHDQRPGHPGRARSSPPAPISSPPRASASRPSSIRDVRLQASVKSTLSIVLEAGTVDERVDVTADRTTLVAGDSAVGEVIDRETIASLPVPRARRAPVRAAGAGRRAAGAGLAAVDARQRRPERRRRARSRPTTSCSTASTTTISSSTGSWSTRASTPSRRCRSSRTPTTPTTAAAPAARSTSSCEVGHERPEGQRLRVLPPLDAGRAQQPAARRQPGAAAAQAPVRRHARRPDRPLAVVLLHERRGHRRASRPTRGWRTCRPRPSAPATSAPRGVTLVDPFTQQPFPGNVIPASRISRGGRRGSPALYPAPNRADAAANLVSSPQGGATRIQCDDQDRPPRLAGQADPGPLHLQPRGPRPAVPDAGRATCPASASSVLDSGPQVLGVGCRGTSGRALPRDARSASNALDRENVPQSAGADQFAALGITRPPLDRRRPGLPDVRRARLRDARRRHQPAGASGRRARSTSSETLGLDRGRHHVKLGGELRHYQSDGYNHLFARGQAVFTGAFTGHPVGDLLLGYPTITLLAANDNRQALRTWSANVFAQDDWRISSRADGQRRRALRVQRAARRRRRSHADLRPGDATACSRWAERRAALRPRLATSTTSRRASAPAGI